MVTVMKRVIILWLTALMFSATTGQADELSDELAVCRDLASAVARLDCYDATVDRSRQRSDERPAAVTTPPAAVEPAMAIAVGAAATEISQENLFGKNTDEVQRTVEEATGDERIDSLSATVTRLQQSGYDKVIITLDNGQVWQQVDTSSLRLKVGDDIRIDRAALSSYMLQKTGSKRTMRVSRRD